MLIDSRRGLITLGMQMQTLAVTLSYLIYDLVCCHFDDKPLSLDNSIHHLVGIVGIGAGLFYQMVKPIIQYLLQKSTLAIN